MKGIRGTHMRYCHLHSHFLSLSFFLPLYPSGVDISRTRLTVCRQVLLKYQIGRHSSKPPPSSSPSSSPSPSASPSPSSFSSSPPSTASSFWCRLLCADGCSFQTGPKQAWAGSEEDVLFDSRAYDWEVSNRMKEGRREGGREKGGRGGVLPWGDCGNAT